MAEPVDAQTRITDFTQDRGQLDTLAQSYDQRRPRYVENWFHNVQPLLLHHPQIVEGKIRYLVCGSAVYSTLSLADKVEQVEIENGKISTRKPINISPLTKGGLMTALTMPYDVDTITLDDKDEIPSGDNLHSLLNTFWLNMPSGMRSVLITTLGNQVLTTHPVDNFAFRVIAHRISGAGEKGLKNLPRKLDLILRSLEQTWPESEIKKRVEEAILALQKFQEQTYKLKSPDSVQDFAPDNYYPMKVAREKGQMVDTPTLSKLLTSLGK